MLGQPFSVAPVRSYLKSWVHLWSLSLDLTCLDSKMYSLLLTVLSWISAFFQTAVHLKHFSAFLIRLKYWFL